MADCDVRTWFQAVPQLLQRRAQGPDEREIAEQVLISYGVWFEINAFDDTRDKNGTSKLPWLSLHPKAGPLSTGSFLC